MLISLQSTMEFITTTKGQPALIFNGSRFTLNRRMDNGVCYWDVQKGPCSLPRITTEGNDLNCNTQSCCGCSKHPGEGDSERHKKEPGK